MQHGEAESEARSQTLASARSRTALFAWLSVGTLVLLGITSGLYLRAHQAIGGAHRQQLRSFFLADELRQSSDDLTRMARTFAASGEARYKRYYQAILDIRDGVRPHPRGIPGIGWDLLTTDGAPLPKRGPAVPLLQLMRRSGFTAGELALLERSKRISDALTKTEFDAIALVEAGRPTPAAARRRALHMLHDEAYHQAKAQIMRPIATLHRRVERRTQATIEAAESRAAYLRLGLLGLTGLLLLFVWRLLRCAYAERRVRRMAFYDGLTSLPNRRLLMDRMMVARQRASRDGYRIAVLYVDLDEFKPVNDTFGHEVGDWLLEAAAARMQACLRRSDTVARIGGDEFVVLLPDLKRAEAGTAVGQKLRDALRQPFEPEGGPRLQISCSIGVAVYPDHAANERDLLRRSDEAMYRAKQAGRDQVVMATAKPSPDSAKSVDQLLLRVVWHAAYASGDEETDTEHEALFREGGALLDAASRSDTDPDAIEAAAIDLVARIEAHYIHEEAILRDLEFAGLEAHVAQHRQLSAHIAQLQAQVERGEISHVEWVEFIVGTAIAKHMLDSDRAYFPLLATRGAPEPATGEPAQRRRTNPP